jgi:hypothetical protein
MFSPRGRLPLLLDFEKFLLKVLKLIGQHPLASDSELPPENRAFRRDRRIFRGDLIGDGGWGETRYNLRSDAFPYTKDAEDQGAPQED